MAKQFFENAGKSPKSFYGVTLSGSGQEKRKSPTGFRM